jgi:hypothetical protein
MMWLLAGSAALAGDPPSVGLDVPVLSSYVWRGQTLSDRPVLQPSLTAAQNGFALNTWATFNLDGAYQGDFSAADADYNAGCFGVDDAALNDLVVGLALPVAVRENLTIKPAISYVYLPDSDIADAAKAVYGEDDRWVGSLVASYAF